MAGNTTTDSGWRRKNRWRPVIWGVAAFLLLLPAVATQFTSEVNWTASDFITMGAMLSAACGAYELATWLSGDTTYRAAFGIAVVTAFLLVWINLAVGILGSEHNGANLMFGGVLLIAGFGALFANFRARGMARAMVATVVAQLLAAAIAVVIGFREEALLAACFAMPWLVSAQLFRKAAQAQPA